MHTHRIIVTAAVTTCAMLSLVACAGTLPVESHHPDENGARVGDVTVQSLSAEATLTVTGTITTSPARRNSAGCLWKLQLSGLEPGVRYVIMNGAESVSTEPFTATNRKTGSASFSFVYTVAANLYVAPDHNRSLQSPLLYGDTPANPNLVLKDARCPIAN